MNNNFVIYVPLKDILTKHCTNGTFEERLDVCCFLTDMISKTLSHSGDDPVLRAAVFVKDITEKGLNCLFSINKLTSEVIGVIVVGRFGDCFLLSINEKYRRLGFGTKLVIKYLQEFGVITGLEITDKTKDVKQFWQSLFRLKKLKRMKRSVWYLVKYPIVKYKSDYFCYVSPKEYIGDVHLTYLRPLPFDCYEKDNSNEIFELHKKAVKEYDNWTYPIQYSLGARR